MSAAVTVDTDSLNAALWRAGSLAWKLDDHQLRAYEIYRAWEKTPTDDARADFARIFVFDIGRRWGKTYLVTLIKVEDCIRMPGARHTYGCAFNKDISDIIIPIMEEICSDAPPDCSPKFQRSKEGESMGFYFPNDSVLKLIGIDMHPGSLRGRASDGVAISEAGFVRGLASTVKNIIYPQFQRRPHARLILESNAPEEPDHDFDAVFAPDARLRGAYLFQTIDDNTALDASEKEEFIRAAGGRGAPTCEREYYGVRMRDPEKVVVPEFDEAKHVRALEVPKYADCYVAIDPGVEDLCGILWGYYDFAPSDGPQRLVVQRCWAERNANTSKIADVLRDTELELWSELTAWDGKQFKAQPYLRTSDHDLRLIGDLQSLHGISVMPAPKHDAEAALGALRVAIDRGQIVINPECKELIEHLRAARWNPQRTSYERSERFGHFDLLDCLKYMWRVVARNRNPFPPYQVTAPAGTLVHVPPIARFEARRKTVTALEAAFGRPRKQRR